MRLCWLAVGWDPDDEQKACSKQVEVNYWNKLKVNSAPCWFIMYGYITHFMYIIYSLFIVRPWATNGAQRLDLCRPACYYKHVRSSTTCICINKDYIYIYIYIYIYTRARTHTHTHQGTTASSLVLLSTHTSESLCKNKRNMIYLEHKIPYQ